MQYSRIIDHPNLIKDHHSKAILNTDEGATKRHELRLAKVLKEQARDEAINTLRNDMADIKELLTRFLNKGN
jgi:hypothetical protein